MADQAGFVTFHLRGDEDVSNPANRTPGKLFVLSQPVSLGLPSVVEAVYQVEKTPY